MAMEVKKGKLYKYAYVTGQSPYLMRRSTGWHERNPQLPIDAREIVKDTYEGLYEVNPYNHEITPLDK